MKDPLLQKGDHALATLCLLTTYEVISGDALDHGFWRSHEQSPTALICRVWRGTCEDKGMRSLIQTHIYSTVLELHSSEPNTGGRVDTDLLAIGISNSKVQVRSTILVGKPCKSHV